VLAIALYGSMAKGLDGPYSDIEMTCIVRTPGVDYAEEWAYGIGKAEVNFQGLDVARRWAATVEDEWPLEHGRYLHAKPIYGDAALVEELRHATDATPKAEFDAMIASLIVGDIYEVIGKVRNANGNGQTSYLPVLACRAADYVACVVGLAHRRIYTTRTTMFQESLALPSLPEGYAGLCRMVMTGTLDDPAAISATLEALWTGLGAWTAAEGIDLSTRTRALDSNPFL
jgi:kanamycin nucleotidyltransferase